MVNKISLKFIVLIYAIALIAESALGQEDTNTAKIESGVLHSDISISIYKPISSKIYLLHSPQLNEIPSNQEWLNNSIYDLTFWKTKQKFLGMELCEPINFSWEIWGDNPYSDMRKQVEGMEYELFIRKK